jgi:hypothetical protein
VHQVYLLCWYKSTNTDTEGGRVEGERDEERANGRKVAAERERVAAGTQLTYADVWGRVLSYADVYWRMLTFAHVC